MRHTFTTPLPSSPPTAPSEAALWPSLEAWVSANPGLTTVAIGLLGAGAFLFSPTVRKALWVVLRFVLKPVVFLGKYLCTTTRRAAAWVSDKWQRVTTPLEDRDSISKAQKDWESEREALKSEISKCKRLAEKRRQEVNTVADERDEFRRQLANAKTQQNSGGTLSKALQESNDAENKVDLEILKSKNSSGLLGGGWVLRNWGPGTAYNVYLVAIDADAKVKQNTVEMLAAQEDIVLFDRYSALPRQHTLRETPMIRVTYENAAGKEIKDRIPFPRNMYGL